MSCGIYFIVNLIDRKRYIGCSRKIEKRYANRYTDCASDWTKHHNKHLVNAANKYGNENFRFIVVEECLESELEAREIFYDEMFPAHMKYNAISCGKRQCIDWNEWRLQHPEWKPTKKYVYHTHSPTSNTHKKREKYVPWYIRKEQRKQISETETVQIYAAWSEPMMTIDSLSKRFKKSRPAIAKCLLTMLFSF